MEGGRAMSASPGSSTSGKPDGAWPGQGGLRYWECARCGATSSGSVVFCQHCGALSDEVEDELRARGEQAIVDGLRALREGDEPRAYQVFVAATEQNPRSEAAWYWRARTAETVEEVIRCLEQLLQLNPDDRRAQQDLEQARQRKERADALARAQAPADSPSRTRPRSPLISRAIALIRRALLDLGSLAAFLLGLVWGQEVLLDAARGVGAGGFATLLPSFQLPRVMLDLSQELPLSLPLLPSRLDATSVAMLAIALGYLSLAFRLGDGSPMVRGAAVVAGVGSAIATLAVGSHGLPVLLVAVVLAACALVGRPSPARSV